VADLDVAGPAEVQPLTVPRERWPGLRSKGVDRGHVHLLCPPGEDAGTGRGPDVEPPEPPLLLDASPDYLDAWDPNTGKKLLRSSVPGLRDFTGMTYTDDGRWLAISRPRSVTVLDAQTFRVAAADISLPTDRQPMRSP